MLEKFCSYCEAEQEQEQIFVNSKVVGTSAGVGAVGVGVVVHRGSRQVVSVVANRAGRQVVGVVLDRGMHKGEAREEAGEDCFEDTSEDEADCAMAVLHHDEDVDYRVGEDLLRADQHWCDLGKVEVFDGSRVQADHQILEMVWTPVAV